MRAQAGPGGGAVFGQRAVGSTWGEADWTGPMRNAASPRQARSAAPQPHLPPPPLPQSKRARAFRSGDPRRGVRRPRGARRGPARGPCTRRAPPVGTRSVREGMSANAQAVLRAGIDGHSDPASIMAGHGPRFFASESGGAGAGRRPLRRSLGARAYGTSRRDCRPQASGKIGRAHGEAGRRLDSGAGVVQDGHQVRPAGDHSTVGGPSSRDGASDPHGQARGAAQPREGPRVARRGRGAGGGVRPQDARWHGRVRAVGHRLQARAGRGAHCRALRLGQTPAPRAAGAGYLRAHRFI